MDDTLTRGYLARIGCPRPDRPDAGALRALHRAHQMAVPFENLSIHLGEPIVLTEAGLLAKIVTRRRGGFCYELNGAFGLLLEALGFGVERAAARVFGGGGFGPPFDHMALVVLLGHLAGESDPDRWSANALSFFGAGSYPEPPDTVPLRFLGLDRLPEPKHRDRIKSAFRKRLAVVHPDVGAYAAVPELQEATDKLAAGRPEVAELVWARDVLLRKVPKPVTDSNVSRGEGVTRNAGPSRCKRCDQPWIGSDNHQVRYGRWAGYCWRCVPRMESERQRDLRRQARADRECETCSATFTPERADGRYCSAACRQKAYRRRQIAGD